MTEVDLRLRAVVPAPLKVTYEALTDPAALRVWLAEHADVDLPGEGEVVGIASGRLEGAADLVTFLREVGHVAGTIPRHRPALGVADGKAEVPQGATQIRGVASTIAENMNASRTMPTRPISTRFLLPPKMNTGPRTESRTKVFPLAGVASVRRLQVVRFLRM